MITQRNQERRKEGGAATWKEIFLKCLETLDTQPNTVCRVGEKPTKKKGSGGLTVLSSKNPNKWSGRGKQPGVFWRRGLQSKAAGQEVDLVKS